MSETTYSLEYAKSARSKCKRCKETIAQGDVRMVVTVPGDEYDMSSNYHVGCFVLPRKVAKLMDAEEFVREHVTDTSEDKTILPDQFDKIVTQMEEANSAKSKKNKKVKGEGGDDGEEETFMTRIAAAATAELEAEEGKPPEKKKAKKGTTITSKAEEEEFCKFVEIYKEHHNSKADILKDFLRWNRQVLTGKKDFVLFKVLDGHVHGRLGRCPLDGGRLKFMEGDYETVHCPGGFDEDSQIRLPCAFTGKRTDPALRLQPFYTYQPTEKESEEMDKQVITEAAPGDSGPGKELIAAAEDSKWDLESSEGIKEAAAKLVDLVQDKVDLPEGRDPKRLLGQILVTNKDKGIKGVIEEIISKYGFKDAKDAKKAAKEEATMKVCVNPKNAPLLLAFQELAELYFKEKNTNAGASYKKVINALKDLEAEVTAANAMSFSKGKTKIAGVGKSSAEKMKEFLETGTIQKLEEKRALHS